MKLSLNPTQTETNGNNFNQMDQIQNSNDRYDVCMVFPVEKETNKLSAQTVALIKRLGDVFGQNNLYLYRSRDQDEVIMLIRVPLHKSKNFSDISNFYLEADRKGLEERASIGWPTRGDHEAIIKPLKFEKDRPDITRYEPFEYIFLKYKHEDEFQSMYKTHDGDNSPFGNTLRIKVIQKLLQDPDDTGGLELKFNKLIKPKKGQKPVMLAVFPLHDEKRLIALKNKFFSRGHYLPWRLPMQEFRDYFGEKISLYYEFMQHFSFWISFPAIVGLGFELVIARYQDVDHPIVPFYSIFIVLWGVFMLEFWKRKEKFIAMEAGMLNFEEQESYRAEFEEEEKLNLSGSDLLYYPPKKRSKLITESFLVLAVLCFMIVGTTACIYVIREKIAGASKSGHDSASIIASILNAVQIQFYGRIYSFLSDYLTDRENHETETEYEDSMIAKNFIFTFINSYTSFFYIAFFAARQDYVSYPGEDLTGKPPTLGQCGYTNCMQTLAVNLGIVLAVALVVGNLTEVILPYINVVFNRRRENKNAQGRSASPAEKDYVLEEYNGKSVIGDYLEVAVLFGYMTMFVSALPGAAFIVFFNLWLEIKADGWKLLNLMRRPWPMGAQDIGSWQAIFDLVIAAAVVTNAAMIVFTMDLLNDYSNFQRFWIFVGFQWVVFSLQFAIRALIPDTPHEVEVQKARADFINKMLIQREVEEDDSELFSLMTSKDSSIRHMSVQEVDSLKLNSMIKANAV